jgi:phage tail P2-like protein
MTLLPPNATKQERDIEASVERLGNVSVPIDQLWNAETCPVSLLPWLAWAFSVDYWDSEWTEAQKRNTIAQSVEVHRRKGTRGAVEKALDAIGSYGVLTEPHEDETLEPYTFDVAVQIEGRPVTDLLYDQALDTVNRTKNVRSHLRDFRVPGTVRGDLKMAGAMISGEVTSIYPYFGGQESVSGLLYFAGVFIGYDFVSVYPPEEE